MWRQHMSGMLVDRGGVDQVVGCLLTNRGSLCGKLVDEGGECMFGMHVDELCRLSACW